MSEGVDTSPKSSGFGFKLPSASNLRGGLIVTILGLGLFVGAFYVPSHTVPQVSSVVLILVGLAILAGLVPIRAPQDFYGGIALVMLATLAVIASAELPGQRGFAFGPGTAPRLFAAVLTVLGAAVAATGLLFDGAHIEKYKVRGPVLVIIGILSFAVLIRGFSVSLFGVSLSMPAVGLIPATFLAFMISIFGSREFRLVESLIAAAAMTAFCVLLFVYLLNLPFQLWPRF